MRFPLACPVGWLIVIYFRMTSNISSFPPMYNARSDDVVQALRLAASDIQSEDVRHDLRAVQLIEHAQHSKVADGAFSLPRVSDLFETDIVLTPGQARRVVDELTSGSRKRRRRRKRKISAEMNKRWKLPIYYTFDGQHNKDEMMLIRSALEVWQNETCIDFVYYDSLNPRLEKWLATKGRSMKIPQSMLVFGKESTCWSYVGNTHSRQQISIVDECFSIGTILHEIAHALGFWHEQSRPDRDEAITVHFSNILPGKEYNFVKQTWREITDMGVPYDPGSNMHYGPKYFSRNDHETIQTNDPLLQRAIGQRQTLSFYDIKLANFAYCSDKCHPKQAEKSKKMCERDGYPDPRDCGKCKCPDGFVGNSCQFVVPSPILGTYDKKCGGVIDSAIVATGRIQSPHFPYPYSEGQSCNWLIKAHPNRQIFIKLSPKFNMGCTNSECVDFIEVRYKSNLAATGARFCCSAELDDFNEIRSDGNEMLILLRSHSAAKPDLKEEKAIGFEATYRTASCGGCEDKSVMQTDTAPPCIRRVEYECTRSWTERYFRPCTNWWQNDGSCGDSVRINQRTETCHREQMYCCTGFNLIDGLCTRGNSDKRICDKVPYRSFKANNDKIGFKFGSLPGPGKIQK